MATALVVAATVLGLVPSASPAGAQTSPRPVLLVGGFGTPDSYLDTITFLDDDYQVYTQPLAPWWGITGAASMSDSAQLVADKVDQIMAETGADKVDIIGHSLGAPVVRYYVKFLGGLTKVDGVVSLGGVNYGIPAQSGNPLADLITGTACVLGAPICPQIFYLDVPGNTPFLLALNNPDPTPGALDYFHFWTETDEGGDPNYPDLDGALIVKVQDMCPGRVVNHVDEWEDAAMQTLMAAALERQLQPGGPLPACPA